MSRPFRHHIMATMASYDLIVVLAQKLHPGWKLAPDLQRRLDHARDLYLADKAPLIAVSGRWVITYEAKGIVPPITEAECMKRYLIEQGVPANAILKEETSQDTIGNAYFIKQLVQERPGLRRLLIVCATPHLRRVCYIFDHVFGDSRHLSYGGIVPNDFPNSPAKEEEVLRKTKEFFGSMRRGDDSALEGMLYGERFWQVMIGRQKS
ncbi:protein of unknown function DUF218 [candidate division TM7 genomosp. GTL1]|nr:protein of unknown function DUF218 [candidate division TM7 genomosp. GTL1]